jgi:hypothetical protein
LQQRGYLKAKCTLSTILNSMRHEVQKINGMDDVKHIAKNPQKNASVTKNSVITPKSRKEALVFYERIQIALEIFALRNGKAQYPVHSDSAVLHIPSDL